MKGQINIEFLAAAGLFILTLVGLITSGGVLPEYSSSMDRMSLNLESKMLTDRMITQEGYHSYGPGGSNWEKNASTIASTSDVGIASDNHVIDRSKLESLRTVTTGGTTALNYSSFREAAGVKHQYSFDFVWMPTVQTNYSYIKGSPPSDPGIFEPSDTEYRTADNRVHYGKVTLTGNQYNFLVAAHDGQYDSVYVSIGNWNFDALPGQPYSIGQEIDENGFILENIQNRENDEGAMVILSSEIKEFGPSGSQEEDVVTLDRFAVFEGEPMRVEVQAW